MTREDPLDRFTILRELGRGTTGPVYAARDRSTGAAAALKTLDPALLGAADAKLAMAFLENARSAARLRHSNIVKVLDAGEAGGMPYVAMELVEGKTLRQMLADRPLPIARAIRIFDDVASALAYAHEEGMVHRGVRPSNIFVLPSGAAKIGDFGTGQVGDAAARYLSPEQVRGDPIDPRTDLYSLGAVLYEMLTHRAPFGGHSSKEIRENILRSGPRRPSEANPSVPAALDEMVLRLLARNPDERPAGARDLLRELQRLEESLGLRPGVSPATPEPAKSEPTLRTEPRAEEFQDFRPIPVMPQFDEREERLREQDARVVRRRGPEPARRSGASNALAVLAIALAVFSIGLTVVSNGYPGLGALRTFVTRTEEAPAKTVPAVATVVAPPPQPAPLPVAETVRPAAAEPIPPAPSEPLPAPKLEKPAAVVATAPQPAPPAPQPKATLREPQPAAKAKLIVAVSPGGEIYVDGKHAGTAPQLTTLDLEPGMHRIEIRSGSRRPYLTYMVVEPGEERHIRYDFDAKAHPRA